MDTNEKASHFCEAFCSLTGQNSNQLVEQLKVLNELKVA